MHLNAKKWVVIVVWAPLAAGIILMLLGVLGANEWGWHRDFTDFIKEFGIVLSAATAVSLIHEEYICDEMTKQFLEQLDKKLEATNLTGLRLKAAVRRHYSGYYKWITEKEPQDLFISGRCVLHRIDSDLRDITKAGAEETIFRRLAEGSDIKIVFLDPRSNILSRLAIDEGQKPGTMLADIGKSLEVCHSLHLLLHAKYQTLPRSASLSIRVFDRIPNFAYHRQGADVLVGFYFLLAKGYTSAVYEVVDDTTKGHFDGHFDKVFNDAIAGSIMEFNGDRHWYTFNETLFDDLKSKCP